MNVPDNRFRHASEWSGYHSDKDQLRSEIWSQLQQQQAVTADPAGHIPAFKGAEQAVERLAALPIWQQAQVVKCNPDKPQLPVRLKALQQGKLLYMAVPRLTQRCCFVELSASRLQQQNVDLAEAAIARRALTYGNPVEFEQMQPIDLVLVGCVAVSRNGGRTGKGAGFADLELAMLQAFGLIRADTIIATTVHSTQIVAETRLPMLPHDWPLDWIITPEDVIETHSPYSRPQGLDWATLRPEQIQTIPMLKRLYDQRPDPPDHFL